VGGEGVKEGKGPIRKREYCGGAKREGLTKNGRPGESNFHSSPLVRNEKRDGENLKKEESLEGGGERRTYSPLGRTKREKGKNHRNEKRRRVLKAEGGLGQ